MLKKLEEDISKLVVKSCRLKIAPEEIAVDQPLFGEGLGLDSVDALQIVVAIARDYGIDVPEEKMPDLLTIGKITEFVSSYLEENSPA